MSEKDNGGPAFPVGSGPWKDFPGMTLRDWFAGMVLAGINVDPDPESSPEDRAKWAYSDADAMLAERNK